MGVRWLVNAGLLVLPIGTTIGVLMGIDASRQSSGQDPIFDGGSGSGAPIGGGGNSGSGGGVGNPHDDKITDKMYCQKQVGIAPPSKGTQYILNPNQWGWTEGTPGAMCMNVTSFNNGTYATLTTAPEYSVTWQYPPGPETQPVHAYPNVQVGGDALPVELQTLQHAYLATEWSYAVGNDAVVTTNEALLTQNLVNTNVAVDMFLDNDKANSQNSSKAAYEVMVWFAAFGDAAQPIGLQSGVVTTQLVNTTTFNLYTGKNGLDQSVLTWVAAATTEKFSGDIHPLLTKLATVPTVDFPIASLYLGHLGIGSEAFSANVNVTFSMPVLSIDLQTATA